MDSGPAGEVRFSPEVQPALERGDVRALLAALTVRSLFDEAVAAQIVAQAMEISRAMSLTASEVQDVAHVALLHDVGKIGMPDSLLHKRGALDERERELMCEHTRIGAQIVGTLPGLEHLAPWVRAVHERWDGTGYPEGLAGEQIPLASRIAGVCEAYHAMLVDRPYRRALTREVALKVLQFNASTQFCPHTITALLQVLDAPALDLGAPAPDIPASSSVTPPTTAPAPPAASTPAATKKPDPRPEPWELTNPRSSPVEILPALTPPAASAPAPAKPASAPPPAPPRQPQPASPPRQPQPPPPQRLPQPPRRPLQPRAHGRSPGSRALTAAYAVALAAGLSVGLWLALPVRDVKNVCPTDQGHVQCTLQKAWLPAITVVLAVGALGLLAVRIGLVSAPSLWQRWRRGELWRREPPPPFASDPVLVAATWGLTYEDANPGGLRPKRIWKTTLGAEGQPSVGAEGQSAETEPAQRQPAEPPSS
ncbi:MAG TPA: HD domain-containing phosphohydrolase [Solirubrobacteraceae bacterium]|jgi:hypothetical protein|nr:HD domain-containing phosphohydrolase [Solirubrobacteraceae bacterium]